MSSLFGLWKYRWIIKLYCTLWCVERKYTYNGSSFWELFFFYFFWRMFRWRNYFSKEWKIFISFIFKYFWNLFNIYLFLLYQYFFNEQKILNCMGIFILNFFVYSSFFLTKGQYDFSIYSNLLPVFSSFIRLNN